MAKRKIINPGENPFQYRPVAAATGSGTTADYGDGLPEGRTPAAIRIRPPSGAPNVVIVLFDQSCYADPQIFGGRIRTPTLERLATKRALTYTNFKVNAACSPTRTALLTGRNSHQNSMATVTGTSSAYPGDTGVRPLSISTVGTIFSRIGDTARVTSARTTRCRTPKSTLADLSIDGRTRSGFDKFYGYIAGEQSNFFPSLIDGTTFIGTPHEEGYHFDTDMTNKAISWVQATRSLTPDRPFMMYYAAECQSPAAHAAGRLVEEGSVQGGIRRRLGQVSRDDAEEGRSNWASCHQGPSWLRTPRACRHGTASTPMPRKSSPAKWRCTPP